MANYILGIDGGGTKTIGRILDKATNQQWHSTSGPSSLTNNLLAARQNVTTICAQLLECAKCKPQDVAAVFGIAGAGNNSLVSEFKSDLNLGLSELTVVSDARTSLYGADLGMPVAVVALGTGSVGMRMQDDGNEFIVGGWGFSIGDQGSGAKLGQMANYQSLSEIDNNGETVSVLASRISKLIGKDRAEILQWIRHSLPNEYAALAPLIFELKDKCDAAASVLNMHLEKVENLRSRISASKGNAVDGACILAERFLNAKVIKAK